MRIALALAVALLAAPARAADYYVANGGSDAATGLSPAAAWATLGHAAGLVSPGDTVHVADGSYQGFYLTRSGAPGSPITFRAEGPAVQITADNGTTPDGINLEGASYVVIDGFVVNDRTRTGIRTVLGQAITIRNCRLGHNGRWGILTGFVDDLLIEGNEAYLSQVEHGIYVSNSGDRPVIRGNVVHDNHANGIHMNGDLSQGGDGLISNAVVEGNVISGNGAAGGSGINMDGVTDSVVRNNLLFDNHASGISLYRIDGAAGSSGNLVVNNTVVQPSDGRWCLNIADGSTGNTVRNNVLWNDHAFRGAITLDAASLAGFSADHDAVIGRFSTDGGDTVIDLAAWQALGHEAHGFVATPAALFVTPGSDFHLRPGSPAIDGGTLVGAPASDLDGGPRPVGAAVDVGAYEAQLPGCGNGDPDPGEQCGEPALPACGDPCTACSGCTCAPAPPACGDGLLCPGEACESDADCTGGRVCQACACVAPPACASGITIERPVLRMRASPGLVRFNGEAVIPKPWAGIDPAVNGVRVVIDSPAGGGGVDVTVPGGAGWSVNAAHTRWRFTDASGMHGGVNRIVVRDRSAVAPGRLRVVLKARGGTVLLPPPSAVRGTVIAGTAAGECATVTFAAPGGVGPRCQGDAGRIGCR
jgi:hypothetical protein